MKFIPYEKLSKRKKKEQDSEKRNTWGGVRPVTRVEESDKAYKRHEKHKKNLLNEE